MFYPNTKIYSDGSHYIAIPHTTNPTARRSRVKEEMISVIDEDTPSATGIVDTVTEDIPTPKKPRQATRSDLFDECYKSSLDLPKPKRQPFILSTMRKYFSSQELTKTFVDKKIDDKIRSNIARRVRFIRKALNNEFNYFMTVKHFYGHFFRYTNNLIDFIFFRCLYKKFQTFFMLLLHLIYFPFRRC